MADAEHGEVAYLTRDGRPVVALTPIDPEQAWFWTPEWQAGEREADQQIARGELSPVFESVDEMFDHLDRHTD